MYSSGIGAGPLLEDGGPVGELEERERHVRRTWRATAVPTS